MDRHPFSNDDWSWWQGEADRTLPSHTEDEEEPEPFFAPLPGRVVPAGPSYFDDPPRGRQPLAPASPRQQSARQRKLARIVAPLLILGLLAALVVVLQLPDTSAAQPTITQSSNVNAASASPAAASIQAYIVGEVVHPGVYPLPSGSRVDALLQAAGGAKPDADLARVNLAAVVTDGEEVFVPAVGQPLPSGLGGGGGTGPGKVDINTASAQDMATLLPISLTTCNKIVAYREAHGPYTSITQLVPNVMSRSTYDKIKDLITV